MGGMRYYQIDGVPFATNAVPTKGAIEIDQREHDALALASVKPEPVFKPVEDPLEKRVKALEDAVLTFREAKM